MEITKQRNGNGTSTWTYEDGTVQIRCNDCNNWHHAGVGRISHSKRCDTPQAQQTMAAPSAIPHPCSANGLTNQEALDAVQRGYLTSDQAMNRDF